MKKLLFIVFALCFSAGIIAQETVPFINAPSQAAAGTLTYNMPVIGGYTLGTIDWDGFASTINSGTYGSELTCDISGPLGAVTLTLGSGTTYAPGSNFAGNTAFFDNSGDPAGTWVFDFYETYDDGGDGLPDANWDYIDFDFNAYAAPGGVTAPWTEVFGAALPAEWTNSSSTGELWVFSTSDIGHSAPNDHTTGSGYFAAVDDSESPHSTDVTLTTPMIDVSALTTPYLDFWMYSDDEGTTYGNMTLHINVWDGTQWLNDYATFSGNTAGWENKTVNLAGIPIIGDDTQIQFVGDETTSGTGWYDDISIDDVTVDEAPVNPIISVSPSVHNYNFVQIGNTSSQTFTVTNIGGGIGNITSASIAGDSEFSIFSTTGIPGDLPPDLIQVVVDFAPLALGTYSATLTITDAGGTTDVLLSGEGVAAIPNDDCASAITVGPTYPETVLGTTIGAEIDCPGVLDWGAVWYEVTLPYALNDLSASYCGTATPPMYTGGIVYLPDCASCASYVIADAYAFDPCPAPDDATLQMSWDDVPGPGTIMFPAYAADASDLGVDFMLTFDVIDASVILPGTNCAVPIVVGALPYATTDNTSLYGDEYSSADEICSSSSYLNGDDVFYAYTPAVDECVDITLSGTGTWVGLFVYEGCDPFTTCVGVDTQSGGNPSLTGVELTGGTTYYIVISTWPSPQSTAYDMEIDVCPDCPAPTNLSETNITQQGADLNWDFAIDSFFDIFVVPEFDPPPGPGTIPTISNVPGNSVTWDGGTPSTSYDWYVRTDCGFVSPEVDYFWMAMEDPGVLIPPLSGGLPVDDLGEDGLWWEYPNATDPWWNIWFYNGDFDPNYKKLVKVGFWVQSYLGMPGELNFVINWSNDLFPNGTGAFPTPLEEMFIERSPINGPIAIAPGVPQWVELTYMIEDYCPEWISIDLWGEYIQILDVGDPPPAGSPLLEWWVPGSPGGILVHECLPEPMGNNSPWTGPSTFTTLAPAPPNDLCANAEVVICDNVYPGTTAGATADGITTCSANNTPGVWYLFTGTGEMVSADLCNGTTTFDTRLSIFEGTCGSPVCVDGNDDYCGTQSRVDWYAENGVDYYILVSDYSTFTTGGPFDLTINCDDPPTAIWEGDDFPYDDWFGADNWDAGDVPGATTIVTIPPGLTDYPTIDRTGACGDIFLGSDGSGTATLVDTGDPIPFLTVNGTATVQRYYPTGAPTFDEWHLISAPISNAQAGIYNDLYLQWYEEGNDTWHDIIPLNHPMTSLQGFAFYAPLDMMTFDYIGNIGSGPYALPISAFGPIPWHWNLFGNPYPSCLDWDLVWPPNVGNLQSGAVYYLDQATGNYVSYNGGMGGGVRYVPPGQGFFVSGAIDMAPFVVDNTMRTHTGSGTYYKDDFDNLLVLEATGNDFSDATYLRFDAGASEEIDQLDAYKLFTVSNPHLPQLYTMGGDKLSINVLPQTEMVPAGFKAGVPGEYTINIKEVTGMANVILEDLVLQTQIDLMENDYTFIYNLDDPEGRFIIHFTPLAVNENLADLINIYSYNKDVYVNVPMNTKGDIVVFNTMGQEVARTNITDAINVISLEKSAYYVVKVMSNESVVTKKVFVK